MILSSNCSGRSCGDGDTCPRQGRKMNGASAMAKSGNRSPADRFVKRACCTIALLMLAGTFAIRFSLFQTRWLNPDEFEHLHAAWCQSEGLMPYRDCFEHHTPWSYWLLLPLMKVAHEAPDIAARSMLLARGLCVALTAAALGAVVCIGALWGRPGTSWAQSCTRRSCCSMFHGLFLRFGMGSVWRRRG